MRNWKNIIFAIISIVLSAFLATMLIIDHRKETERAIEAERIAMQERRITYEKQQVGEEICDDLIESIQNSFPGIICWGDESMVGNRRGNLPSKLDEITNTSLFETIESDLSNRTKLLNIRGLNIQIINMGVAKEGFYEILTRTGARQLVLGDEYTIPASTERNNITLADTNGRTMLFAEQRYALFGDTTISGVTGRLYDGNGYYDSEHMKLSFGRDRPGTEIVVPAGTPVYTAGAAQYQEYIPVLFFAESNEISIEEFIEGINDVLSLYGNDTYTLICTTKDGSTWDVELKNAFGSHYIRNEIGFDFMREENYQSLATSTYENLKNQGLFDEIINAVGIAQVNLDERLTQE